MSASKLSRIETGARSVSDRDIRRLAALYGVEAREQEHLLELAEESKQPGWWQKYELPYAEYVGLESTAAAIHDYRTSSIPSLLQTADYARAIAQGNSPHMSPSVVETRVEAKMIRRRILDEPDGPKVRFIVDEAALRRPVGGSEVMRGQLLHIASLGRSERVSFQVIPFSHGWHPAMDNAFTILSFDVSVRDVVYIEGLVGDDIYLENPKDLERYRAVFSDLAKLALDEDRSLAFVRS